MNEKQYNDWVKKQLDDHENDYYADIKHDKELVWERLEGRLKKKKVIPVWIYSAAALILIFLAFGFIFNRQIGKRDQEISELKARLEQQQNKQEEYEMGNCNTLIQVDTLKLVQQKMVYKSLHFVDTIVKYDTISNLAVVSDTVYIKVNQNELIADKETLKVEKLIENKDFAVNQVQKKRKNNKRFIFRFGKQNDQIQTNENAMIESKGLISLQSK